ALRAVPRWEGRRDHRRGVPRRGAVRRADLARHLGCDAVALRIRLRRVHHGGAAVPGVGMAHRARRAVHPVGGHRAGAAARVRASEQYRAVAAGDGESVPHEKGDGHVTRVAVIGGGAWGTALADLLARKEELAAVTVWAGDP